nr:hypothetical protein [uncultured Celeribacter sp.]
MRTVYARVCCVFAVFMRLSAAPFFGSHIAELPFVLELHEVESNILAHFVARKMLLTLLQIQNSVSRRMSVEFSRRQAV